MKKYFGNIFNIGVSLFFLVLSMGNFYLYRPVVLDVFPKMFWIPLSVLMGGLLSLVFIYLVAKIRKYFTIHQWALILVIVLVLSAIVFYFKELYYFPLTPNTLTQVELDIKLPGSSKSETAFIADIRVDQRNIKFQESCVLTGTYRWQRQQTLVLENGAEGSGEVRCRLYPQRSVDIVFLQDLSSPNILFLMDGRQVGRDISPTVKGNLISIDTTVSIRGILPYLLLFLNIFSTLTLLVIAWSVFQVGELIIRTDHYILGILGAYLICYFTFFILPVYFNNQHVMFFPQEFSTITPIGDDFYWVYNKVQSVIFRGEPLGGSFYSPGMLYFFIPLALLNFDHAYKLLTIIKLVSIVFCTFMIPAVVILKKNYALPLFFLLTGLVSYGFKFEVERGQSYSLIFALIILSVWLFQTHYSNRFLRFVAYVLFTITVQMKLSPVIFVVFFIKDWKNLRSNILRITLLGAGNVLLIFSLGFGNAMDFFRTITKIGGIYNEMSRMQNHSINGFITWMQTTTYDNLTPLSTALIGIVIVCVVLLLVRYFVSKWNKNDSYIDPLLFIGLALLTLLVPNENNDYTLVILPLVLSVGISLELSHINNRLTGMDLFILSFLYSMTLYSNVFKPDWLFIQNNCLILILMLVYLVIIAWSGEVIVKLPHSLRAEGRAIAYKHNFSHK
jgi:hypothetical protein